MTRQTLDAERCAYCGEEATTKDHSPPRSLLRKPLPSYVVTVPACAKCNVGFSVDEAFFKAVLACLGTRPDLVEASSPEGSVGRAMARNPKLKSDIESAIGGEGKFVLSPDVMNRLQRVLFKTVQGVYWALYGSFVPVERLNMVCFHHRQMYSLEDLVDYVRPPQVLDITDEPLPEITPSGWASRGQAVVVQAILEPIGGGEPAMINKLFWMKQETPVDWVDYQEGIFKFGFVGTEDRSCVCAIELWETLVIAVSVPWPSGRGHLRRGRNGPFSRERVSASANTQA